MATITGTLRVDGKEVHISSPEPDKPYIRVLSNRLDMDKAEIHIQLFDGKGNAYTVDWVGEQLRADYEPKS